jgi:hypothetical protein
MIFLRRLCLYLLRLWLDLARPGCDPGWLGKACGGTMLRAPFLGAVRFCPVLPGFARFFLRGPFARAGRGDGSSITTRGTKGTEGGQAVSVFSAFFRFFSVFRETPFEGEGAKANCNLVFAGRGSW